MKSLLAAVFASLTAAPGSASAPRVGFETHVLPNGLKAVLAPDPAVPVVTFAMAIPVGSRQERKGRAGFAHLFEHLMFTGSANLPKGRFDKILENFGAENNAFTDLEYTYYYETLPAHALPVALWLDADRLSALEITQEALKTQVDVVKEEKLQNVYNEAYGPLLWIEIASRTFSNWQNAHDSYGDFDDLDAADMKDVRKFFDDHYAPENVRVAVVGDFDPEEAKRLLGRYFGWIANRGKPERPAVEESPQAGERRFVIADKHATVPGVAVVYNNMPPRRSPGYYALTLLGKLLFEGKSARLYQKLVKDAQVATAIDEPYTGGLGFPVSDFDSYRQPGLFGGFVLRKDSASVDAVRDMIYAEAGKIGREGVSQDELNRVKTKFRSDWIRARQTTRGRAAALLRAEMLDGDASAADGELEKFLAVSREDVAAAARDYLRKEAANVFELRPAAGE